MMKRTMRTRLLLLAATASVGLAVASPLAQTEIPVPPIATRLGTLPGVNTPMSRLSPDFGPNSRRTSR